MPPHTNFIRAESAGGLVLILSGAIAMVWANSTHGDAYFALFALRIGGQELRLWVNDGLMAIFFLLAGLELRREILEGELASPGRLAAPAVAAFGGMIVPAVIFSLFNYQDRVAMRGWATPVATDIAFALAVLGMLGRRVPIALTVFLTALAVIDDLGAIVVIALFYSDPLQLPALAAAVALIAALWGLNRAGIRVLPIYLFGGVLLWLFVFRSGVHSTLSGVALAFLIPARASGPRVVSPAVRLEAALQPFVAYLILPLFGLVNAGFRLGSLPKGVIVEPLFLGTAVALLVGKPAGVFGTVMLARRLGLASMPAAVSALQLCGAAVICGIGFTMSLFIGHLAFGDSVRQDEVKLAVFAASLIGALLGSAILATASRRKS